jgi:hypothetical protein
VTLLRVLLPLTLGLLLTAVPAWPFGPAAHRAVSEEAVETLPKGLKPFYKAHKAEMTTLSFDGLTEEESPERRFAIDRVGRFPFDDVARTEATFKEKHAAELAQMGRLPWLLKESYARLVVAFKAQDRQKILAESDVLAGLVTDLHNPLAVSRNSDGQETGQHGLWMRFSVNLPEAMQKRLSVKGDAADFLDRPNEYVFRILVSTYVWLDNLLYEEDLARRSSPGGFGDIYYDTLARRAGLILKDRLSAASSAVGSFWYTAWTEAGRPELK